MASFEIKQQHLKKIIGKDVFVIMEVGSTHCASIDIAKKLIDCCKENKVDCIKFQKRDIDHLLTKKGKEETYNSPHALATSYGEHRKKMEFSKKQFKELLNYTLSNNMFFTASAWDIPSIDFLCELKVPFLKIASADLTNLPLLHYIATKNIPVVLSTGMGNMIHVHQAYQILKKNPLAILQCTSSYPTPPEEINLNVIQYYQNTYPDCVIGFSGHSAGFIDVLSAVSLGAKIIEKHLTLNQEAKGSDHKSALCPLQLKEMTNHISFVEKALGTVYKEIQPSEKKCIQKLCKSICSKTFIPKGTILNEDLITTKSPANGIPAFEFYKMIGKKTKKDILNDTSLQSEDLENLEDTENI
jgi:sialic acid synthase